MPRGFEWAIYVGDDGNTYALRVDADYILEFGRGWSTAGTAGVPPLPRGWRPRRVVGIGEDGSVRFARVASVGAELWTGATSAFFVESSNSEPAEVLTYEVIARHGERSSARPTT